MAVLQISILVVVVVLVVGVVEQVEHDAVAPPAWLMTW